MGFLFVLWVLFGGVLIVYHLYFHMGLWHNNETTSEFEGSVSVIICARNEESNLRNNLPAILEQDYPDFEVIVVDDRSTDGTSEYLNEMASAHTKLRVLQHRDDDGKWGKKRALRFGIAHATYERLLLTDADCMPESKQWIRNMAHHFSNSDLVLGFGAYHKASGFTNKLARYETLQTAMSYFGFADRGLPYMGVGRNMAYSRKLYNASDRFESHLDIPSGDDDLFVSQLKGVSVSMEMEEGSFTLSEAVDSVGKWYRQKRRHLSTSFYYPPITKFLLALIGFSQLLFYIGLITLPFFMSPVAVLTVALVKLFVQALVLIPMARKLKSTELIWLFPLWEFILVMLLALIQAQNVIFGSSKRWR